MYQPNMDIFRPPSIIKSGNITISVKHVFNILISQYDNKYSTRCLSLYSYYHYQRLIKCDMLAITLNLPQIVKRQVSNTVILLLRRALPTWIWTT